MRRALLTLFAMSVMSSVAFAQAGLGTWKGEVAGRGGGAAQEVTVMISRGDDGLMGKWMQGEQEEDLANVTAEGATVSFERTVAGRGGGGQGFTLSYSGEIEGNQLTLTQSFQGGGARGGAAPAGGGGGGARGGAAPAGGGGGARGGAAPAGGGGGGRGGGGPIVLTKQ